MFVKTCLSNPLILLFILPLFLTTTFSQSSSYLDSLNGKFALQFQINENFSLSNFQGTVLSGKYHFSARDAIRLGISLSFSDSDEEASNNIPDTISVNTIKIDQSHFGIIVNTQYIRYIQGTDDIAFFVGGGPFIEYFTSTTIAEFEQQEPVEKHMSKIDSYTFGMDLLLGVEWWFHKYLSLSAEYGIKFMYKSNESLIEQGVLKKEQTDNYFRITANSINFGITVYF